MGFLHRILITALLCCAYGHHVGGQALVSDSCENRVFTNDAVSSTKSDIKIGGHTFHRHPKVLAAFDCCNARKQNLHCTLVCFFQAKKMMNADGTWNKPNVIRTLIEDWQMELGPEIIARVFQCIDKYGPYKPSSNCHDIEKAYTCAQNHFIELNPGQLTSFFLNTYNLDVAHWNCGNRTYHVPEPFMELARDCLANATTVYQRLRCTWRACGLLDDNFDINAAATQSLYKLTFGKRGTEIVNHLTSRMKQYDVGKLWRDSIQQPENAVSILSDFIADSREALYEICGTRTDDFLNSC